MFYSLFWNVDIYILTTPTFGEVTNGAKIGRIVIHIRKGEKMDGGGTNLGAVAFRGENNSKNRILRPKRNISAMMKVHGRFLRQTHPMATIGL